MSEMLEAFAWNTLKNQCAVVIRLLGKGLIATHLAHKWHFGKLGLNDILDNFCPNRAPILEDKCFKFLQSEIIGFRKDYHFDF